MIKRPHDFGARPITQTLGDKAREFLSSIGEYQLFVDIWEDQGAINWALLDVQMAAIRINHISGGTHKDTRFDEYWSGCPLIKVPYFVYNPWNTGQQNYDWLIANCPPVSAILLDVEVIYDGYSPTTYAKEFDIFYKLCAERWNVAIYTAEWFLQYLAYWPNADYWWAQWPYQFYPDSTQAWLWSKIHTEMESRGSIYPSNQSQIPGSLKFWQFTGDRLILPGSTRVMDVNVAYGSLAELAAWAGGGTVEPPADIHEKWFNGKVDYFEGWREVLGRRAYVHVSQFKRSDVVKVHTNGAKFLGTSEYWWNKRIDPVLGKAHIVINGDEGSPVEVKGLGCSDGNIYKLSSGETSVQWDDDSQVLGMAKAPLDGVWNACGGSNILLLDGVIPDRLYDADKQSVDPRTSFFWNDTDCFIITVDGRNNGTLGLTLRETAEFALTLGATNGHNFDGGDSCQLLYNDNGNPVIKNNMPDGTQHAVVNHVGFWFDLEPKENGDGMEITVLKTVRERNKPNYYADGVGDAFASEVFLTDVSSPDTKPAGPVPVMWYELEPGKWAPDRHHTDPSIVYLEVVIPTPPPAGTVTHIINVYDDGKISVDNGEPF